ncbi:MAG: hypothetical protein IT392_03930 [Nitrospirae bacterium]|nr:hypothetical protein [Nitrospirota bacterium]
MRQNEKKTLLSAIVSLLQPLVRILLRNGVPYGTFVDLAKNVYVKVAMEEFGLPNRKQTASRVSILTGLTRKEVSRVEGVSDTGNEETINRYNRAARVITGWVRDSIFCDNHGNPADLKIEGPGVSFSELVRTYSGDMPVRAVLDELDRVGAIDRRPNGRIRLIERAYIPAEGNVEKLAILGTDVRDLISTIDNNITKDPGSRFLQRKVSYDNLPQEVLPEIRRLSAEKGQLLLEELDAVLSQHDRDVNPTVVGTGRQRAGIGIYYFEDDTMKRGEGQ